MEANHASPDLGIPQWTIRRVITATLVVVGVTLGFFLLFRFELVIFSLFEAVVFSTAISPLVDWLQRRGISRPLGVALVYLSVLMIIAGFVFLLVPLFAEQGTTIAYTLTSFYQDFKKLLLQTPSILVRNLATRLPAGIPLIPAQASQDTQPLDKFALAIAYGNTVFRGAFTTIAVLLLTSYWTLERDRVMLTLLRMIPPEGRESARSLFGETGQRVGSYIRGLAILCLTVGTLATIAYLFIGLPYVFLLGILAGLLEAVPLVGPILGAFPAVLVTLTVDPNKVIWVIGATVLIQLTENHLLVPRVMNQTVGVNPVVSLLAFAAFSSLFGLAGALLAIPLAVVIQLLINHFVLEPSVLSTPPPQGRDAVSMLRLQAQELIQDVRKQVREKDGVVDQASDQVEDAIEAIVNDLDSILAQAEIKSNEVTT